MEKTRKLIIDHPGKLKHFEYYIGILDKIDENIQSMPDVTIESCKSLIEGISKTILENFSVTYGSKDSPDKLLKTVLEKFLNYSASIDQDFVWSAVGFTRRASQVRNSRGDISHGKSVPKLDCSDTDLAEFVAHTTDGIVSHILKVFVQIDQFGPDQINYEDNSEFNDFLNEENPLDGLLKYSKALFDQDSISYREQLNNFLSEKFLSD